VKKLFIVLAVLAVGLTLGKRYYEQWAREYATGEGAQEAAAQRVNRMLLNMVENDLDMESVAMATWGRGKLALSKDETKFLEPYWIRFWQASKLSADGGWQVTPGEVLTESRGDIEVLWVRVELVSGERKLSLKVPVDEPIEIIRGERAVPYREIDSLL
jgi:hypothetical protein